MGESQSPEPPHFEVQKWSVQEEEAPHHQQQL